MITILLLSGCVPLTDSSPSANASTVRPSATLMILDATVTRTPRPTLTPLPTSTVTLTALPTLTTSEAEIYIMGLYNNNCELPCWGGYVPGKATWLEVKQELEAANIKVISAKDGGAAIYEIPRLGISSEIEFYASEGQIFMIRPFIKNRTYDLQPMFLEYGKPDEVWISAYPASGPPNYVPFGIILFYEKGISILYNYTASVEQDYYKVCPVTQQIEDRPILFVWEPERYLTLKGFEADTEAFGITIKENLLYKPLEETTETSIEELYNELLLPSSYYCIKTPKSSW